MGRGMSKAVGGGTVTKFDDQAKIETTIIGRLVLNGQVVKEGHTVEYSKEYVGDGKKQVDFFRSNSNSYDLIDSAECLRSSLPSLA